MADDEKVSAQRQLVFSVVQQASSDQAVLLKTWATGLLDIRRSDAPVWLKAQRAVSLTRQSAVIIPVLKLLGRELKRRGWDDRGTAGRLGLGGAAVGLAVFGAQGAGITALGTAIGVPLWVVFGSGAAFAGVLIDEATRKATKGSGATFSVIDAKRIDESE